MAGVIEEAIVPAREPDWYVVPSNLAQRLAGVPGLREVRGRWYAHRSMLPLVRDDLHVARLLDKPVVDLARRQAVDDRTAPLGFTLRPHQHVGVEFIAQRRGTLLADEPRCGKTLTAILAHDPSQGPFVVFCPMMVREVWVRWLSTAFPGERISVLSGRTYDASATDAPFIVGHYDILKGWQISKRIGTLVFDEAHVLTNKTSQKTVAASYIVQYAERVIGITGTPLWNKPIGLYALLNVISQSAWGGYYDFGDRYAAPSPTAFGRRYIGTSNEPEFMARLGEVMLHRKHRDIASSLPPVTRDVLVADLSLEQRYEIDLAAEELRTAGTTTNTIGSVARYRKVLGEVKLQTAVEAAKSYLEKGEPVVLWAWHKSVARALHRALKKYDPFLITGDAKDGSTKKRDETLQAWKKSRSPLVITIAVGQVGIDLSHSHICVFAEVDFTPALIAQAEMRTYAPTRPMHVQYVVADHVVDRQIVQALQSKLANSDKIGVPAAEAAIDVLKAAFSNGPMPEGDLDRMLREMLNQAAIEG